NGGYGFSGDGGPATSAALSNPSSVFVDIAHNIFITDYDNDPILQADAPPSNIQTVAGNGTNGFSGDGGPAANAELWFPSGVWGEIGRASCREGGWDGGGGGVGEANGNSQSIAGMGGGDWDVGCAHCALCGDGG